MGPKFGAQQGNEFGSQLGPMSITKLSLNWACQMGPIHCPKFLLSGMLLQLPSFRPTRSLSDYFITTLFLSWFPVSSNVPSNFLKFVCAQNLLCATFYQDSCMKHLQEHFLHEILCALHVFLCALISRPVRAHTAQREHCSPLLSSYLNSLNYLFSFDILLLVNFVALFCCCVLFLLNAINYQDDMRESRLRNQLKCWCYRIIRSDPVMMILKVFKFCGVVLLLCAFSI